MDTRRLHAAAEAIAQRWPNLALVELGGHRLLSTAELLAITHAALDAADDVDELAPRMRREH